MNVVTLQHALSAQILICFINLDVYQIVMEQDLFQVMNVLIVRNIVKRALLSKIARPVIEDML